MLIIANSLKELRYSSLMEVYRESNLENAREFWPGVPENQQILQAEQGFYHYLKEGFFMQPGAVYCVWEEDGRYISALRLEPYEDGLLLEALETAPEQRRKGYAKALIQSVLAWVPKGRIYSHVAKRNAASLATHRACGFEKILEYAKYIDGSVSGNSYTLRFEV